MSNLLEQASLVMIPSGYKEDVVYSEIPINGAGDLSFTRASNGTRINSAGLVEDCPWNLLQYSENFTSGWITVNSSITANSTTAPNGTTTADTFTLTASSDSSIYQPVNGSTNNYSVSIYAKYVSGDKYLYIFSPLNSQSAKVWFDIQNGTVSNQSSGFTGTIENAGNGWYRCSLYNTNQAVLNYIQLGISTTNSSRILSNNSVSYIWGAQINTGALKPYFPTTDRLNVPRLTYQNGGGGCPSLLLEKQSTNLALYSQDISNTSGSAWGDGSSGGSATLTANYATSPDGTQNATRVQLNQGSGYGLWQQILTVTPATKYTYSIWLKSLSGTPTIVWLYDGTNNNNITLTSEWVRYTFTYTAGSALNFPRFGVWSSVWGTSSTADILAWGAQLEASSYPTSYIPTTSSSATRVADLAYKSSISSLFGASATSFFMDFEITQGSSGGNWTVTGYDGSNLFSLCQFDTASNYPRIVFDGGVDTTLGTALGIGRHKIAVSFATNDFRAYIDGALVLTDTSCTYNRYDRIAVNGTAWTGNTNNTNSFKLNQYAQFPNTLTNAELASLTTI